MQLPAFILPFMLLASSAVANHGNSTMGKMGKMSTASQCREMEKLTKIVDLAANTTRLDDKTHGNATKVADIQAKASAAANMLSTMQSNTTLTTICAQRAAVETMAEDCRLQSHLEKLMANSTKMTSRHFVEARKHGGGNHTIDMAAVMEKLSTLSSNQTLQQFCASMTTSNDCRVMKELNKMVNLAANDTALANKFKDNSTKVDEFKTKAAEVKTKLADLMGNSTLMSICDAEVKKTDDKSTNSSDSSSSSSSSSSSKSPAAANRVDGMVATSIMASIAVYLAFIVL